MKAIVGDEFKSFLYEWKDADLLVRTELSVFVLIEYAHEFFDGANSSKAVELWLKLFEDNF